MRLMRSPQEAAQTNIEARKRLAEAQQFTAERAAAAQAKKAAREAAEREAEARAGALGGLAAATIPEGHDPTAAFDMLAAIGARGVKIERQHFGWLVACDLGSVASSDRDGACATPQEAAAHIVERVAGEVWASLHSGFTEPAPPPVAGARSEPGGAFTAPLPDGAGVNEALLAADPQFVARLVELQGQPIAFNPDAWRSLGQAKLELIGEIVREHGQRTATRQHHLDRVLELSDPARPLTPAGELELNQHRSWARELAQIDDVRAQKLADAAALEDLDAARAFASTLSGGWS